MIELHVKLPMLGSTSIPLFKESERIYKEFQCIIDDQKQISHLGVASEVFSGITHTRYEYILLQLAIVKLISKLFKEHSELAIAAEVKVPHVKANISSGEELIKSWILLNSIGHINYTFGTERILLNKCISDATFCNQFMSILPSGTRRWASSIIKNFEYERFFKLIAFYYISQVGNARDKNFFTAIYKSIVLPLAELNIECSEERTKLLRLKNLYDLIRLISQLSIDSFYSHSPVTLELSQVLMNLDKEILSRRNYQTFTKMLNSIGATLSRDTYLHPSSMALIGKYEMQGSAKIDKRGWQLNFNQFLTDLRRQGFGAPKLKTWGCFLRITLTKYFLPNNKIYSAVRQITNSFDVSNSAYATIVNNYHATEQYIDISANIGGIRVNKYLGILRIVADWFMKRAEIAARVQLINFKKQIPDEIRTQLTAVFEKRRFDFTQEYLDEFTKHSRDMLKAIIRVLIKPEFSFAIPCPTTLKSAGLKIFDSKDSKYCTIDTVYKQHMEYYADNSDRCKEIECIRKEVDRVPNLSTVICCFAPVIITNVIGKKVDEWDGVLLVISKNRLEIRITEVKNKGPSSCSEAFKQLKNTKKFLCANRYDSAVRQRISNYGARLLIK
ncbi:MAG: hypothetical protein WBM07_16310 [Chitinivibrionales bacterium]